MTYSILKRIKQNKQDAIRLFTCVNSVLKDNSLNCQLNRAPFSLGFYLDDSPFLHGAGTRNTNYHYSGPITYSSEGRTYYTGDVAALCASEKEIIRCFRAISSANEETLETPLFADQTLELVSKIIQPYHFAQIKIPLVLTEHLPEEKTASSYDFFCEQLNFSSENKSYCLRSASHLSALSLMFKSVMSLCEPSSPFMIFLEKIIDDYEKTPEATIVDFQMRDDYALREMPSFYIDSLDLPVRYLREFLAAFLIEIEKNYQN